VAATLIGHPALHSFDLANEIDQAYLPQGPDAGWLWARTLSHAIRDADEEALISYGAHILSLTTDGLTVPALAPSFDFLSMHSYPIYSDAACGPLDPDFVPFMTLLTARLGSEPCLMQEFGLCTAPPGEPSHTIQDTFLGETRSQFVASEDDAASYYEAVLGRLWRAGSLGAIAWDFSDYSKALWDRAPLDDAKRERTFGLFRADGSPKPAAEVLRRFAAEVRSGGAERRLGPRGGGAPHLEVDPVAYYRNPESSFRDAYRQYRAAIG
jgi:endo-1,4-beta-mannosidase